jgi:hypothetical protein
VMMALIEPSPLSFFVSLMRPPSILSTVPICTPSAPITSIFDIHFRSPWACNKSKRRACSIIAQETTPALTTAPGPLSWGVPLRVKTTHINNLSQWRPFLCYLLD